MTKGKHTIRQIRLVPWDIGVDVTPRIRKRALKRLKKVGWRVTSKTPYCRKNTYVLYKFISGLYITLDLFDDGFSVFSIHEAPKVLNQITDFDPVLISEGKTDAHRKILTGRHKSCPFLYEAMKALRSISPKRKRRYSANPEWENSGMSYVFSFFLISTNSASLRKDSLQPRCMALLFPIPSSEITGNPEIDQTCSMEEYASHEKVELLKQCTIASGAYKRMYFSWATSILAGPVSGEVSFRYFKNMRELQHAWFSAYVGDQWLDKIVEKLPEINKVERLIDLDNQMNKIGREVSMFTSIPDSMATSLQMRTYRVAANQSGLNELSVSINSKLQLVRHEIASRIEKRNLKGYRALELILALLAFVQAVSAYKSIEATGGLTTSEINVMGGTLVALLLVFLFR